MKINTAIALFALLLVSAAGFAQAPESGKALPIVRNFLQGYYLKDEPLLQKTLPNGSDLPALLQHPDLPPDRRAGFSRDLEGIRPGNFHPSAVDDPKRSILTFKMGKAPWILPLLREGETWKIDPRYALAAQSGFGEEDPRGVIIRFAMALFSRDKQALASIVLLRTEKELDAMLKENKLGYEDRQRLIFLASMMPMAFTRTGEEISFPNGELRTALNDETEQTFLALLGFCELPFRVKNIDGLWKVYPQPYAQSLKAAGMAK